MHKLILVAIVVMALFLRVWQIDTVPPGVYMDEASIGYDAYSIGQRGEDQFGKSYPMFFRSFATYQAPLYIYLTVIPVKLFGITPFSVRLISILAGVLLVLITYFFIKELKIKQSKNISLFAAGVVAISPWAIFFSRGALESNLGLLLYVGSLYCFFRGLNNKSKYFFIGAFILLGLTNYAYHAYRILSLITLGSMLLLYFKDVFSRKLFILGIITFLVILIPQLFYVGTEGSTRRYYQLEYTSDQYFETNGGEYKRALFGKEQFILRNFLSRFVDYLSPKSLFLDSDTNPVRSIPDLAVFYPWFIIPFFYGLYRIRKKLDKKQLLFFLVIILAAIFPSAITRETLYTLRILPYLWIVGLIISLGLADLIDHVKAPYLKVLAISVLVVFSLGIFYFHYFVLVKNERRTEHSGLMFELFTYTKQHQNNTYIVDLSEPVDYSIAAFVYTPNLENFEKQADVDLNNYYDDLRVNLDYSFDNLVFRPISWEQDTFIQTVLVGDELTIPDHVAVANGLEPVVTYKSTDIHSITIYKTNPKQKCIVMPKTLYPELRCTKEIMQGD